ncbi:hypothetical protein D9M68_852510 [compost metagenome]
MRAAAFATAKIGFMMVPEANTKLCRRCLYASMSVIGRRATPLSAAACATAGAIFIIKRGSKGLGIRYSGPKASFSPA